MIEVTVRADAFCHSMVRSLVGALTEVGTGRARPGWLLGATAGRPASTVPCCPRTDSPWKRCGYPPDNQLADRVTGRPYRGSCSTD